MSTHAAVNVPSNDKIKEADINNKTQLYGIGQAFALGKAPSNKQIDIAMNSALANKALSNPSKELSADGRQLIGDLRSVIEQAKVLFLTKNEGNLLQDFAWQCQDTAANGVGAGVPGAPIDKNTAKQHGNEALEGLRTLGQLLITNGQFRKLIQDMGVLARDIAGDAAQNAAHKINPSEDQLNNIDEPAEDNTWHDSPDYQGMKNQAAGFKNKIPFGNKGEAKESLKQNAQQSKDQAQSSHEQGGSALGNLKGQAQNMANSASANMSEEDKQKAEEKKQQAREKRDEAKDRTQNYLKEKVPKERREQAIYRLKKMIVEIQGHSDYQSAIDTLLRLAEEYKGHTKTAANDAASSAKGAHSGNNGLNAAEADLRIVLERFANNTSMDDLFDSVNAIYRDADQDPELKGFFRHLDTYIRKCLKEQGFVLKDEATEQWNQLYDQGNFLLRDRYKNHTNRVLDEIKFFGQQFDNDPLNKRFGQSMNKLFQDLGTDKDGKPEFKPHLLRDLRDVIIPQLIEGIRYIPIPDIEFTSTDVDVVIRDLVVEADNILPNIIDITSDNHFRYGRKGVKSTNKNKFIVHVSGIQTDLTNIRFYSKAKKGIKLRNWGLMDVRLEKTGLDFKIHMETADKTDGAHFFKVSNVDVKISNLKLNFREQHHPILTKVAALFAKGSLLSGPISKVLEVQIKKAVSDADAFAYQIYQDVQKAKAAAKNDPENAQNVFKQYFDAYQQRLTRKKREGEKKKEQAKAKAAEKEVQTNIAFTKETRISKNWNGGKGIPIDEQEKNPNSGSGRFTLKTAEYNKLAHDGNKWESPVFSIGSAKESTNLPKVSAVSRKPHDATSSQLRGKEESRFGNSNKDFAGAAAGGAGLGAAGAGAGYGSSQSAGAGQDYVQPGYGAATGTGYGQGQGTPASLGQSSGSAFNDTTYSQTNGNALTNAINDKSGTAGQGDLGPSGVGNSSTYTTLGTNNPVLTGRV